MLFPLISIPNLVHANFQSYWFQVGVSSADQTPHVTGASVEIKVHSETPQSDGTPYYWIGLTLANGAFLQVGYMIFPTSYAQPGPHWIWEYFPPNSNSYQRHGSGELQTTDWVKFRIQAVQDTWSVYMNEIPLGHVQLTNVFNSGSNVPGAIAEEAGATLATNRLGPVEFRNLQYETSNGSWQPVKQGQAFIGYGVGSDTLPQNTQYPYGVEIEKGKDNYWLAGSVNSSLKEGETVWPWYYLHENGLATNNEDNGWYPMGTTMALNLIAPETIQTGQSQLVFWYFAINDQSARISIQQNSTTVTAQLQFTFHESVTISPIYRQLARNLV
jgi:hypothetical protein